MMPLIFADIGSECVVKKISGSPQVKKHLESLGFTAGSNVSIINAVSGNIIVNVKGSRIAVSREMAQKIFI